MQVLPGNGEIIQTLRRMPKLQAFERKDLRRLLSCSRIVRYEPGEIITREDEPDPGTRTRWSGSGKKTASPARRSTTW